MSRQQTEPIDDVIARTFELTSEVIDEASRNGDTVALLAIIAHTLNTLQASFARFASRPQTT